MKRYWVTILSLLLCLVVLCAGADTGAIWVDGNGIGNDHVIQEGGNGGTQNTTPGTSGGSNGSGAGSGGYATATPIPAQGGSNGNSGSVSYVTPPPEEDESSATADPSRWSYESTVFKAVWKEQTCEVIALGQYLSTIKTAEGTAEVYTRELTWDTTAPEGKTLAVINAPSSGTVRLRRKASGSSAILYRCQTGRVVPVLSLTKNKKYAYIQYEDARGYVLSSSLIFVTPSETNMPIRYIAYKGNPKSGEPIKVRQKASSYARVLDELPCGQRVTALETDDKWTKIEAGDLQCWIMSSFLTEVTDENAEELPRRGTTAKLFYTSIAAGNSTAVPTEQAEASAEPPAEETAIPDITPERTPEPTPEPAAEQLAEDRDHSDALDALENSMGYGAD